MISVFLSWWKPLNYHLKLPFSDRALEVEILKSFNLEITHFVYGITFSL